jgi:hypothetical protein
MIYSGESGGNFRNQLATNTLFWSNISLPTYATYDTSMVLGVKS